MVETLWPAGAPPNALQVVRTYVARLRAGPLDAEALVTRRFGYELRAPPGSVDADRLEALIATGRAELAAGDATAAEAAFTDALALVRGPPLPELPDDLAAAAERERLDELLVAAEEELAEARLTQGRHRELVPALRAATAADPLRERRWAQLMVALYRCGRQAEALDAYRGAHAALAELGLTPGPSLRELERMILLQDAALDAPVIRRGRVPRYRTSFVGRAAELDAVEDDLRAARLTSLVGPAGAGKTRLAAEAADRAARWLGARVWWVDLGAVGPGRIAAAAARALAAPQVPGRAPADLIAARLAEAPGLLVLDNCEHVLDEAADLVSQLLDAVPAVRILATSREPLRIHDERVHRFAGLAPDAAAGLFRERAAAADVSDAAAVAEVVERLDGLPLAIELAAAKLSSVSVAELARGLRRRLSLLDEGPRDAPARQRTLDAAIAWSHDLRSPLEQRVLRRLAVFPGSFDAAAAEAVAAGDGVAPDEVVPALTRLVDASLLAADPPRYRLLMTVRTYARERLREAGEEDAAAERHRDAYLALAETVGRNMANAGLPTWLPRGRLEHENFQAAVRWSLDHGDPEAALGVTAWLGMFWFRCGLVRDGRALLERAMEAAGPGGPLWPRAAYGRALLAHGLGSDDAAGASAAAVAAAERADDAELLAFALCLRGHSALLAKRPAAASADLERARALALEAESDEGVAFADQLLGDLALATGDLDLAGELLVRARDRFRRIRAPLDAGYTLIDLARVRLAQQRFDDALTVAREALSDFRRREDPRGVAGALRCLGQAYAGVGHPERARPALDEARALAERWGVALWPSGQPDEAGEEAALGARVESLGDPGPLAVRAGVGERRDRDLGPGEELR
jgi:predicted ATPase/DNA-binding SARP family transcriptional activator